MTYVKPFRPSQLVKAGLSNSIVIKPSQSSLKASVEAGKTTINAELPKANKKTKEK